MDIPHKHPLVLVVEPSPTLRKILEITLERAGGQTMLYSEPLQVLRAMREFRWPILPDLAFIDLTTSRQSYRLIRVLKSHPRLKHLAIVAVAPKGQCNDCLSRVRARWAGAIAYLPRPWTMEQILAIAIRYSPH
jgi:twitching motility two-component system response regulator PilG